MAFHSFLIVLCILISAQEILLNSNVPMPVGIQAWFKVVISSSAPLSPGHQAIIRLQSKAHCTRQGCLLDIIRRTRLSILARRQQDESEV